MHEPHDLQELTEAVERLLDCQAQHRDAVRVVEAFQGANAWEGTVHVYSLQDHPEADTAFAWSVDTDDGKRRYLAIPAVPPIDSPQQAVRAAIMADLGE